MCVFCKIINGEIPSFKIYENDYVMCFLDINASTEGHTLIVPKKHFDNIFDIDDSYACEIIKAVKYIANLLKEKLGVSAVNIINNSGSLAGQTVMHFHIHVIPRYENDGVVISPKQTEPDFDKLKLVLEKTTN